MTPDNRARILTFLRSHRWAVEATVAADGGPQAALIGFGVTDQLELVFDTLKSTRKALNLDANPRVALVVGGWGDGDPRTLQCEGIADVPQGPELHRVQAAYFTAFPDGPQRKAWPGITYVRVTPTWMRFCDYTVMPPEIVEWSMTTQ
ncbi:MAG: pyridoxamine 5'-phosphate oxidase family protein [Chitinophagaceae bacterium]